MTKMRPNRPFLNLTLNLANHLYIHMAVSLEFLYIMFAQKAAKLYNKNTAHL